MEAQLFAHPGVNTRPDGNRVPYFLQGLELHALPSECIPDLAVGLLNPLAGDFFLLGDPLGDGSLRERHGVGHVPQPICNGRRKRRGPLVVVPRGNSIGRTINTRASRDALEEPDEHPQRPRELAPPSTSRRHTPLMASCWRLRLSPTLKMSPPSATMRESAAPLRRRPSQIPFDPSEGRLWNGLSSMRAP